jgi:CRISPR-associated protein Csx17
MPDIKLEGCTPEPLMSYLKALGVFRLVAEQVDPDARLAWRGGVACLRSKLDRDGILNFLLMRYHPTPVMTPWNSASGFAPTKEGNKSPKDKAARIAVRTLCESELPRLHEYREAIRTLNEIPRGDEAAKTWKQSYFAQCRAYLPDNVVEWLDNCFAMSNQSLAAFPLLGTGGNDGVTDFGSLFMQRVCEVIANHPAERIPEHVANWATNSLLAEGYEPIPQDTIGQFNPGGVGGANATQGTFEAGSRVNPWDFVLMIEGTLLFAGAVARRIGANTGGDYAAFPFCVAGVVVDNGSVSTKEAREKGKEPPNGGELWLPLWKNYTAYPELKHLLSEGRAQLGRRQARNAVEFAIAISLLGVSRGIESFSRVGFLRRNGKAFLATPLGQISVHERPGARLLQDPGFLEWLDKLRDACQETDGKRDGVPARYKSALRQADRAIFEYATRCQDGIDAKYLVEILSALGRAERTLAGGLAFCKEKYLRPLQGLNSQWLTQANDGSPEFRLAASLAGVRSSGDGKVSRLRAFLEEVEATKFVNWSPGSTLAVSSKQPLAANLAAVFRRRQLEAYRNGQSGVPLDSPWHASLSDIIGFLNEETDDEKLQDLLWGLIGVDIADDSAMPDLDDLAVPLEFGLPRLLVQERCFVANGKYWNLSHGAAANAKPDPAVFHALASGQPGAVAGCVDRAARRLKSFGLLVNGYRNRQQSGKPLHVVSPIQPERLVASMLFPLSERNLERIANSVLSPPETQE